MSRKRAPAVALKVVVSALALGLAFRGQSLVEIRSALTSASAPLLWSAFSAYLASQAVSSLRWRRVASSLGFELPARTALRYYFIGIFFGSFGPGLIGGDMARALYVRPHGSGMLGAAASVAIDRYAGFVCLTVMASAGLALLGSYSIPFPIVIVAHGLTAIGILSWWLLPRIGRLPAKLGRLVGKMTDGWWRERAARRATVVLSFVVHGLQLAAAISLLQAVAPSAPWEYGFVVHPLVAMLAALPISLAGLGVRESGYVYFLATLQGVPAVEAAAFASAWLAVLLAAAAIGGLVFLAGTDGLPRGAGGFDQPGDNQFPSSS